MNNVATATTAAILVLTFVQLWLKTEAYREHKVHNIVLYPDKHSWCKTTTIKQVISYPGCTSIEIDNKVCVGACFSYSIPHTEPSDPGEVIVPYCDSCQPSETTWHQVTLKCSKNEADTPAQLIKHVQIIHNCSCTSCEKNSLGLAKFNENNEDLYLQQSADAELLDALQSRNGNESNSTLNLENSRSKKIYSLLNHKLITMLRNIQTNNSDHDIEQLYELLNLMQEPIKHKLKTKNITDFIETLTFNRTDLDTTRLTEILLKFDYHKHYKKDIPEITNMDKNDEVKHNQFLETFSTSSVEYATDYKKEDSAQKQGIPVGLWLQNPESQEDKTLKLEKHSHEEGDDIQIEVKSSAIPDLVKEKILSFELTSSKIDTAVTATTSLPNREDSYEQKKHSSSIKKDQNTKELLEEEDHHNLHHLSHLHLHQHHVNDNIVTSHGHLARGPHGALVIEPDRIHEEKLDVNAHELKPNHAGTLLSYHSNSDEGQTEEKP